MTGRNRLVPIAAALLLAVAATPLSAAEDEGFGAVPALAGRDLGGKRFSLETALEDGPVVITFWATWCKPCRKELPELQKLQDRFGERGFRVVAVNGDGPVDAAKIRPYVRASKFDFTVIPDPDGEIKRRFQVEVFPTTFLIGGDGRILHRQVGYRRGDEVKLAARLEALLPGENPVREPGR